MQKEKKYPLIQQVCQLLLEALLLQNGELDMTLVLKEFTTTSRRRMRESYHLDIQKIKRQADDFFFSQRYAYGKQIK